MWRCFILLKIKAVYTPISSSWGKQYFSSMFRLISPLIFFQIRKRVQSLHFWTGQTKLFQTCHEDAEIPKFVMPIGTTIDVKHDFICKNNCIFSNYSSSVIWLSILVQLNKSENLSFSRLENMGFNKALPKGCYQLAQQSIQLFELPDAGVPTLNI